MKVQRRYLTALGAILCVAFVSRACATSSLHIPVFMEVASSDPVGSAYAYALKQQILQSQSYFLSDSANHALFQIQVVTLNPSSTEQALDTVYSVTLTGTQLANPTGGKIYLNSWVGICGAASADQCAQQMMSNLDAEMYPTAQEIEDQAQKTKS